MNKKVRYIKRTALALMFISLSALGVHAEYDSGYVKSYFKVTEVNIVGSAVVADAILKDLVGSIEGRNIFDVDLPGIGGKLESHPWISSVKVKRKLPSTLRVEVKERIPTALLKAKKIWLIDNAGVCLRVVNPDEGIRLPMITGLNLTKRKLKPGTLLESAEVINAINIAQRLSGYRLFGLHKLDKIDISHPASVTVKFHGATLEVVARSSGWTDETVRLRTVDYILRETKASVLSIDLTFKDKVIVKYPTENINS